MSQEQKLIDFETMLVKGKVYLSDDDFVNFNIIRSRVEHNYTITTRQSMVIYIKAEEEARGFGALDLWTIMDEYTIFAIRLLGGMV